MRYFEGFLDSCTLKQGHLEARFSAGSFEPSPTVENPILYVVVEDVSNADSTLESLNSLRESGDSVYVEQISDSEATVYDDCGFEIKVLGSKIQYRESSYEPCDFKRLAEQNHQWGKDLHESLTKACARNNDVRTLIQQQLARLTTKAEWHPAGSTARKLYTKQIEFLERLLGALDG